MPDATPAQLLSEQYEHAEPQVETPPLPEAAPAAASPPARNPDGTFAKPAYVVTMARELGLSDEDIEATPAAELRERCRDLHQIQLAKEVRSALQSKPEQAAPPAAPSDEITFGIDDEAGYTEGLVPSLKKYIKQLSDRIGQLEQREQHRSTGEVLNRIDTLFSADKATFGEGSTQELAPDSPELMRRQAVMFHLNNVPKDKRTTLKADFARIKAALHGGTAPAAPSPAETNGDGLTAQQRRWVNGSGSTEAPTGRTPPPEPKGTKRAAQAVGAWMRDNGMASEDDPEMPE